MKLFIFLFFVLTKNFQSFSNYRTQTRIWPWFRLGESKNTRQERHYHKRL